MSGKVGSYDRVARFYDILSGVYSVGGIRDVTHNQISLLTPGEKVLFAGCGGGSEVVAAAARGCEVTAIDASSEMIELLRSRLVRAGQTARLNAVMLEEWISDELYDTVCANFFLNVFSAATLRGILSLVLARVRPGGRLMIADVAAPNGNVLYRTLNRVYLHGAMIPFALAGLVEWHANHDYPAILEKEGWSCRCTRKVRMLGWGPVIFQNLECRRVAGTL